MRDTLQVYVRNLYLKQVKDKVGLMRHRFTAKYWRLNEEGRRSGVMITHGTVANRSESAVLSSLRQREKRYEIEVVEIDWQEDHPPSTTENRRPIPVDRPFKPSKAEPDPISDEFADPGDNDDYVPTPLDKSEWESAHIRRLRVVARKVSLNVIEDDLDDYFHVHFDGQEIGVITWDEAIKEEVLRIDFDAKDRLDVMQRVIRRLFADDSLTVEIRRNGDIAASCISPPLSDRVDFGTVNEISGGDGRKFRLNVRMNNLQDILDRCELEKKNEEREDRRMAAIIAISLLLLILLAYFFFH